MFNGGSCVDAIGCLPKGIYNELIIFKIVAVNLKTGGFCMSACPSS